MRKRRRPDMGLRARTQALGTSGCSSGDLCRCEECRGIAQLCRFECIARQAYRPMGQRCDPGPLDFEIVQGVPSHRIR